MSNLEEFKAALKGMSIDQLKAVIQDAQTKRKYAPSRPTRATSPKARKPKRITEEEVVDGEVGEVGEISVA